MQFTFSHSGTTDEVRAKLNEVVHARAESQDEFEANLVIRQICDRAVSTVVDPLDAEHQANRNTFAAGMQGSGKSVSDVEETLQKQFPKPMVRLSIACTIEGGPIS